MSNIIETSENIEFVQKTWYAVYTKPRWEKKVASLLLENGIEHYCPINKVVKQWSDRKKVVHEPLFKGYVFVKLEEAKKWEVKKISGILNFVYWLGKPAQIRDEEIDTIRKFLNEFNDVLVEQKGFVVNTEVRIKARRPDELSWHCCGSNRQPRSSENRQS